jgi:hypothetical protein
MRKTPIAVAVLDLMCCVSFAGTEQPVNAAFYLDGSKPGIYMTFSQAGSYRPEGGEPEERIWLRVHNNTKWEIAVPAYSSQDPRLGDVGLFYRTIPTFLTRVAGGDWSHQTLPEYAFYSPPFDTIDYVTLQPGASLSFSLPAKHLAAGLSIRVTFRYPWEKLADVVMGREVQHWVLFGHDQLPESLRGGNRRE